MIFNILSSLGKEFLFQFQPEAAHELFVQLLKHSAPFIPNHTTPEKLQVDMWGHTISSPIALAAGFDKYGKLFPYLSLFGFSFSELGSFTLHPQLGNPKPRLQRFIKEQALINKMGFNNPGIAIGLKNIENCFKQNKNLNHKIAISIGKSKITPNEKVMDEYETIIKQIESFIHLGYEKSLLYIVLNLSSPNTPGLRELQTEAYISKLTKDIIAMTKIPLAVKLAPDFSSVGSFLETIGAAYEGGVRNFVLTNTTMNYSLLQQHEKEANLFGGGVSGKPLTDTSLRYLKLARKYLPNNAVLIASGGIMTKEDVWNRILNGASLVQLYSGFIYNGPQIIWEAETYILQQLQKLSFNSLNDFIIERRNGNCF